MSSSAGSGGGGWVRSIAKARSLADILTSWMREIIDVELDMSSVVMHVGVSGAVMWERSGKVMKEMATWRMGKRGSHGAGLQRTVRSSPSPSVVVQLVVVMAGTRRVGIHGLSPFVHTRGPLLFVDCGTGGRRSLTVVVYWRRRPSLWGLASWDS